MTFHAILTLSVPGSPGFTLSTLVTPGPGRTREQIYKSMIAAAQEEAARHGIHGTGATVYFSLEPNGLGVAS